MDLGLKYRSGISLGAGLAVILVVALSVVRTYAQVADPEGQALDSSPPPKGPSITLKYMNAPIKMLLDDYAVISGVTITNAVPRRELVSFSLTNATPEEYIRALQTVLATKNLRINHVGDGKAELVAEKNDRKWALDGADSGGVGQYIHRFRGKSYSLKYMDNGEPMIPVWDIEGDASAVGIQEAIRLARGQLQRSFPGVATWTFCRMSLSSGDANLWHYYLSFRDSEGGGRAHRPDYMPVIVAKNGWMPDIVEVNAPRRKGGINLELKDVSLKQLLDQFTEISGATITNAIASQEMFSLSLTNAFPEVSLCAILEALLKKNLRIKLVAPGKAELVAVNGMSNPQPTTNSLSYSASCWYRGRRYSQKLRDDGDAGVPVWDLEGDTRPLDIQGVIRLARGQLRRYFPDVANWTFVNMSLTSIPETNRWYYDIDFSDSGDSSIAHPEKWEGIRAEFARLPRTDKREDMMTVVVAMNGWMPDIKAAEEWP